MAKKSKTQKAKASANRQAKKLAAKQQEEAPVVEEEAPKAKFSLKKSEPKASEQKAAQSSSNAKSEKKAPKKKRFQFLRDVRGEMKRVTWPTKRDVLQWTGVVLVALLFFSVFCIVLDDWIVTPILYGLSNLGGLING